MHAHLLFLTKPPAYVGKIPARIKRLIEGREGGTNLMIFRPAGRHHYQDLMSLKLKRGEKVLRQITFNIVKKSNFVFSKAKNEEGSGRCGSGFVISRR